MQALERAHGAARLTSPPVSFSNRSKRKRSEQRKRDGDEDEDEDEDALEAEEAAVEGEESEDAEGGAAEAVALITIALAKDGLLMRRRCHPRTYHRLVLCRMPQCPARLLRHRRQGWMKQWTL